MRLLFVCTGNICRSPLAEAITRRLLGERNITDVDVESAGTAAWDGTPASEGAYLVALEHGLDLSPHKARQLSEALVTAADLILGMSAHHAERARGLGGEDRVHVLGAYAGRQAGADEVEDPFGGDLEEYRRAYARLEELLGDAVKRLADDRPHADPGQH